MKKILFLLIFKISVFAYLIELNNICFKEFYDTNKKIPVLAYYYLTKNEVLHKNPKRIRYFSIDKRIPKQFRTKYSDYTKQKCLNKKCDRGHLVGNNIIDYNIKCQKLSFKMSNITPQTSHFNRGIYKKIEDLEQYYALKYNKIFVIKGNFGSYGKIKNNITIPKYFYEIILTKNKKYIIIINQKGQIENSLLLKESPQYIYIKKLIKNIKKDFNDPSKL